MIVLLIVLGIIQGLTEFLPVSSSGNLVFFTDLLNIPFPSKEISLAFDISVHLATILSVCVYMRKFLRTTLFNTIKTDKSERKSTYILWVTFIGSLPALVIAMLFKDKIESLFSSTNGTGYGFMITAAMLFIMYVQLQKLSQDEIDPFIEDSDLSWKPPTQQQAILIGCAQAIAIAPGVSRMGATLTMAFLLGLHSRAAMRFSLLLSIPAILGAGVYAAYSKWEYLERVAKCRLREIG